MKTASRTLTILLLSVAAAPALAAGQSTSTEETAGVGAGVLIGAVAGGPVGALLGGALGAKLGDMFYQRRERIDALASTLDSERLRLQQVRRKNTRLAAEKARLESTSRPDLVALLRAGIEMDLPFRTDEHVLTDETSERLRAFAAKLATTPDVRIRIDGYSDERGDADYNLELSRKRAAIVQDVLVAAGFPATRIRLAAHGESPAIDGTPDSLALERKVTLTVVAQDEATLASAQNR